MGQEISPLEIWVTAKIHEHTENPPNSIADTLDVYRVVRVSWSEFSKIPFSRDVLDQRGWEAIEGEAVKKLFEGLAPREVERPWWISFPLVLYNMFCHCLRAGI